MKYRREIDGLRALAVLPVVFFHAGFSLFSGGFVGVDIFFVISGYLITTLVLTEKEKGTFSLVNFYERRARRILPALFFVMFCCFPFAWLWLTPNHLQEFSKSVVAVSVFSSNILFWKESGYFATAAELKPLLHTWSLAVEEQYYILFPLFVMFVWKLRKRWIFGSLVLAAGCSLALAQWGAYNQPSAAFYLLPARGWELAFGGLIAFFILYRKDHADFVVSPKGDGILGMFGFALIIYSIFAFDKSTPFPGAYALFPTVGAGLIIAFTTPQTFVGRLLGAKPVVGVGLISYSTYLWHQPLFAFARQRCLTDPGTSLLLTLSAISVVFAFFSWRFVERPFRNRDVFTRKGIFSFAIIGSFVLCSVGLAGQLDDGWRTRLPDNLKRALSEVFVEDSRSELWSDGGRKAVESYSFPEQAKRYAYLIGDSHAEAIAAELLSEFKGLSGEGIGLKVFTKNGCPPVTGVYRADNDNDQCFSHNQDVYSYIEDNDTIDYVVLLARWTLNIEGSRFDNLEGGSEPGDSAILDLVTAGKEAVHESETRMVLIANQYKKSVKHLLDIGKKVILVYPIPEAGWDVPSLIVGEAFQRNIDFDELSLDFGSTSYKRFLNRNAKTYEALNGVGYHPNLYRVYPESIFCNNQVEGRCVVKDAEDIFYKDDDHMSLAGARKISRLIVDRIETGILIDGQ